MVLEDVVNEKVTLAHARKVYKVVITKDLRLDVAATKALRGAK